MSMDLDSWRGVHCVGEVLSYGTEGFRQWAWNEGWIAIPSDEAFCCGQPPCLEEPC